MLRIQLKKAWRFVMVDVKSHIEVKQLLLEVGFLSFGIQATIVNGAGDDDDTIERREDLWWWVSGVEVGPLWVWLRPRWVHVNTTWESLHKPSPSRLSNRTVITKYQYCIMQLRIQTVGSYWEGRHRDKKKMGKRAHNCFLFRQRFSRLVTSERFLDPP